MTSRTFLPPLMPNTPEDVFSPISPTSPNKEKSSVRLRARVKILKKQFKDLMYIQRQLGLNGRPIDFYDGRRLTAENMVSLISEFARALDAIPSMAKRKSVKKAPIIGMLTSEAQNFFANADLGLSYEVYQDELTGKLQWGQGEPINSRLISVKNYRVASKTLLVSLIHYYGRIHGLSSKKEVYNRKTGITKNVSGYTPDYIMVEKLANIFAKSGVSTEWFPLTSVMSLASAMISTDPQDKQQALEYKNNQQRKDELIEEQMMLTSSRDYLAGETPDKSYQKMVRSLESPSPTTGVSSVEEGECGEEGGEEEGGEEEEEAEGGEEEEEESVEEE